MTDKEITEDFLDEIQKRICEDLYSECSQCSGLTNSYNSQFDVDDFHKLVEQANKWKREREQQIFVFYGSFSQLMFEFEKQGITQYQTDSPINYLTGIEIRPYYGMCLVGDRVAIDRYIREDEERFRNTPVPVHFPTITNF